MDENNPILGQDTITAPDQPGLFGGNFAIDADTYEEPQGETVSLLDEPAGEETVSIMPQGESRPPISGDTANVRAAKIQFALGNDAGTPEQIIAALQRGGEDALRRSAAEAENLRARQTKEEVIREKAAKGGQVTPEDVAFMSGLAGYEHRSNPETIIETAYGNKYVMALQNLNGGTRNPIGESYRQNPEKTSKVLDFGAEMTARQEIIKNAMEDAESAYSQQGWISWTGDQLKGLIPLYGSAKLGWGSPGNESYFEGSVIRDMVQYYWGLPVDKMATEFRQDISKLAKDNPTLARRMSEAMLSYTSEQQFTDNMFDIFNVATAPGIGTAAKLARRGAGAAVEGVQALAGKGVLKAGEEAAQAAPEAVKAAVRANAEATPNLPRIMNDLGDVTRSSKLQVEAKAAEILKGSDVTGTVTDIVNQVPDFLKPDSIVKATANLSGERAILLAQRMEAMSAEIAKTLTDSVKVGRAPEEIVREALEKASDRLRSEVIRNSNVENAVLTVKHVMPEETAENIGSVRVYLGTTDKNVFDTKFEAVNAAAQKYRLKPTEYKIRQEGTGYVISIEKTLDETSDGFRATINTEANSVRPSLANTLLGSLRSADDRVPQFQIGNRLATVHGRSQLEKVFRDMRNDIGTLNKKELDQVSAVMKLDQHETPKGWTPRFEGDTPPRGVYRETIGEFEEAFYQVNKEFPSEKQIKTYFHARKLQDWDYIIRNLGVYRDRARMGYETVKLTNEVTTPGSPVRRVSNEFIGKRVDSLPYNSGHNAGVLIHDAGKDPIRMSLLGSTPEQRATIEQKLKEGYRIIKVHNPIRVPFTEKFGADPVHFIVTRDVEVRSLDPVQVPYRPGWHSEYDYGWYVKQPNIRKAGGQEVSPGVTAPERHVYEGDKSLFGFDTRTEAEKYATNMEKARKMLLAGDKNVDNFVEANLPFNAREFRRLFTHEDGITPPPFDINAPFFRVENGKTVSDDYGKLLGQQYANFEDAVRSPHNDFANSVDKKFLGERSDPLWTVKEGEAGKPFMQLTEAEQVDPLVSLSSTMSNIMRNRHFADYKISHTEGWVQQFGHLLDMPLEDVRANPVWAIHNGKFVETAGNKGVIAAAEASRAALKELLGTPGTFDMAIDSIRMNVLDSVYKTSGQEMAQTAKRNFIMQAEKDPVSLMRKMAFHLNIGLFNPYQLVQNAATMTHAIAVAGPVNGFSGAASALPMRMALLNPDSLEKFSRWSTAWGWKPEWFKESFAELKRSGKYIVEGEHGWKEGFNEVSLVEGKSGKVLDAGLAFFKEGERISRIAAWNIAFREFRTANPTAAITDEIRRQIMARSDLMTANMTRASNASWQQGLFAIPTQFMSYHTRLAEQMLGKRLTTEEKARLLVFNSMLYGVPIGLAGSTGLGALTGGQVPWHENIRKGMLERGYDPNSVAVDAFNGGVTNLLARMVTGETTDLAGKIGPGGGSFLKNIFFEDKPTLEIMFGASGTKAKQLYQALDPVMKSMMSPFRSDEQQFSPKLEDVVGVIRQVKSVDNALAVLFAHNTGKAYAKNGQTLGDMTTLQAVFQLATGGGPRDLSDMNLMYDANKDRKDYVRKIVELAARDFDGLAKSVYDGDQDGEKAYKQRISTIMSLAELLPSEKADIWKQMAAKHKDKLNQVRYDFYLKTVPQNQVTDRQETFFNMGKPQ